MLAIQTKLTVLALVAGVLLAGCQSSSPTNEENLPKPPSAAQISKLPPDQQAVVTKLLEEQRKATVANASSGPRYKGQ